MADFPLVRAVVILIDELIKSMINPFKGKYPPH